ncbi:MAG TPA: thioredoxin domain-containing protein [Aggregatilineales bacterium]|nr:thioredoxin domain-containing protein [Aggregatilineales bacterium]
MNHLKNSTSPYLLQHAENPVDWYPWGEEALKRAREEDKPILLSVGYSACHWCHVMAHESFEDPDTAAIMNQYFVCIKVDREERPDIDDIYMQATLMFNQGNGGWPMTVFLLPNGRPFHAGTYYPKVDRPGVPSFRRLMAAVVEAYRNRRDELEDIASQITRGLQGASLPVAGTDNALTSDLLDNAFETMLQTFDSINGGLSRGRPKFPGPMNLEYVLRYAVNTGSARARDVLTFTLHKMADGGIYDQVGGGFHRYAVDERWLVPHFEKMLYDNAQLSRLYVHTWAVTGDDFFKKIAVEIYDYLLEEMTSIDGGFYSSTDADSEGQEGKFFLWTTDQLRAVLDDEELRVVTRYWDVTEKGNFEGSNILHLPVDEATIADKLNLPVEQLRARVGSARVKLYAARKRSVPPARDEKILTAWNGLTLASLADGGRLLHRDDYTRAAINTARFLLDFMVKDGRLLHSHKDGESRFNGYLDDYANFIDGLLALYQVTFDARYFVTAKELADTVLDHFSAPEGGFFDTSDDHEPLIARPRNLQDNAIPSGNSMMAKVLVLLNAYTGEAKYLDAAHGALSQVLAAVQRYPTVFGEALNAADGFVRGIQEVAIIGELGHPAVGGMLETLNTGYHPNRILALSEVETGEQAIPPLLAMRGFVEGQPAAYVCQHFACQRPVIDSAALREALAR